MSLFGAVADHYVAGAATYSAQVLADSPAAYWRMGEVSGSIMVDSSGNGRDGTYFGTPGLGAAGLVRGDADKGVAFSTIAMYATAPEAGLVPTTALTVEAVVNPTSTVNQSFIVTKAHLASSTGPTWSWILYSPAGGALAAQVFKGTTAYVVQTPVGTLGVGTTTHVALVFDGASLKLYVGGIEATSVAASGPLNAAAGYKPMIGTANSGSNTPQGGTNFPGTIDEVAIYNSALSPARIFAHANAGTFPIAPATTDAYAQAVLANSPLGYWRLSDAAGSRGYADASGHDHYLTDLSPTLGAVTPAVTGLLTTSLDKAASFSAGARLGIGTPFSWMKTPSFTVEAIIKPTSVGSTTVIAARENWNNSYGNAYSWAFYQNGTALLGEVFVNDTSTHASVNSAAVFTANTTYHVAMTFDTTTIRVYVNGTLVGSIVLSGNASPGITGLTIGQPTYNANTFLGTVDEVAFYGSALSAAQLTAHNAAR